VKCKQKKEKYPKLLNDSFPNKPGLAGSSPSFLPPFIPEENLADKWKHVFIS